MRLKHFCAGLVLAVLWVLAYGPAAHADAHKNFLWKVQSKNTTVYVLGSMHEGTKELYPLSPDIEGAFDASDALAVEANINPENVLASGRQMGSSLLESMIYTGGDTLEHHISKQTYEKLDAELRKEGASIEEMKIFKPWFLASVVEVARLSGQGFSPEYGIDQHFLAEAEGKKKILELEGLSYQFGIFRGLTDSEQELFLLDAMGSSAEGDPGKLLSSWVSGETSYLESSLEKDLRDHPEMKGIFEKFFFERNRGMAEKIEGYLAGKERVFVVVGAGHLVGDRGIIEILREKGYLVEQVVTAASAAMPGPR